MSTNIVNSLTVLADYLGNKSANNGLYPKLTFTVRTLHDMLALVFIKASMST